MTGIEYLTKDLQLRKLEAEDWGLYPMEGAEAVARLLNEGTRKVLDALMKSVQEGTGIMTAAKKAHLDMLPVIGQHGGSYGMDEPRSVLLGIIEEFIRKRFEVDVDLYWEM